MCDDIDLVNSLPRYFSKEKLETYSKEYDDEMAPTNYNKDAEEKAWAEHCRENKTCDDTDHDCCDCNCHFEKWLIRSGRILTKEDMDREREKVLAMDFQTPDEFLGITEISYRSGKCIVYSYINAEDKEAALAQLIEAQPLSVGYISARAWVEPLNTKDRPVKFKNEIRGKQFSLSSLGTRILETAK